jgi:hypothetical protein
MNYEDLLLDFVRRTRSNLERTEEWRLEHPEATFSEVSPNQLHARLHSPTEGADPWMDASGRSNVTYGIPSWEIVESQHGIVNYATLS